MGRRAVVLLSGGLDSATALAIAAEQGYRPCALTLRYGQRHEREVDAARRLAEAMGVTRHVIAAVDLRAFGGSALTDDLEVPKGGSGSADPEDIPITYVPARNTIFLSMALAWAEVLGASDIFIGVNAVDYSGYPDCRPEFLDAFEKLAALATRAGAVGAGAGAEGSRPFRIHAPLIDLTKAETIRRGLALGVDYGMTRSCYDPDASGAACGECDSCRLRLAGFAAAGTRDPAPYQAG